MQHICLPEVEACFLPPTPQCQTLQNDFPNRNFPIALLPFRANVLVNLSVENPDDPIPHAPDEILTLHRYQSACTPVVPSSTRTHYVPRSFLAGREYSAPCGSQCP